LYMQRSGEKNTNTNYMHHTMRYVDKNRHATAHANQTTPTQMNSLGGKLAMRPCGAQKNMDANYTNTIFNSKHTMP
jgi:hypothetical protein